MTEKSFSLEFYKEDLSEPVNVSGSRPYQYYDMSSHSIVHDYTNEVNYSYTLQNQTIYYKISKEEIKRISEAKQIKFYIQLPDFLYSRTDTIDEGAIKNFKLFYDNFVADSKETENNNNKSLAAVDSAFIPYKNNTKGNKQLNGEKKVYYPAGN